MDPHGEAAVDCFRVRFGSSAAPFGRLYGERAAGAAELWKNFVVAVAGFASWFRVRHRTDARAADDRSIVDVSLKMGWRETDGMSEWRVEARSPGTRWLACRLVLGDADWLVLSLSQCSQKKNPASR